MLINAEIALKIERKSEIQKIYFELTSFVHWRLVIFPSSAQKPLHPPDFSQLLALGHQGSHPSFGSRTLTAFIYLNGVGADPSGVGFSRSLKTFTFYNIQADPILDILKHMAKVNVDLLLFFCLHGKFNSASFHIS